MAEWRECVFRRFGSGNYICSLASNEYNHVNCNPSICPLYSVWKILEDSTGIYLGKDMTGI